MHTGPHRRYTTSLRWVRKGDFNHALEFLVAARKQSASAFRIEF